MTHRSPEDHPNVENAADQFKREQKRKPPANGADANGHDSGAQMSLGQEAPTKAPKPTLCVHNPADWEGQQAPPRRWIVPDYVPDETVTLLTADGGTGKGYLGLQLGVARAVAKEWIGLMPEPGRSLICSTEDNADEMWRRLEGMLPFYEARMADLGDMRLVDLVGENSILGLLARGVVEPTPMYEALDELTTDFRPGLVILDVLADLFSGSENDRSQVTQFVGLLKRLCRKHSCAVVLSAQPSVAGMNSGTGTSGTTGWSNAGRSRLYFQRAIKDGAEPNKNFRTIEGKKANYGEIGGKFDLEFKGGLFQRIVGPTGFDKMAADQKRDDIFLALLLKFKREGRIVSPNAGPTFAPAIFSAHPDAAGATKAHLRDAMNRLLTAGKIAIKTFGSPSHQRQKLVLSGGGNADD